MSFSVFYSRDKLFVCSLQVQMYDVSSHCLDSQAFVLTVKRRTTLLLVTALPFQTPVPIPLQLTHQS